MSEHSELGARASNYNSLRSLPEWLRAAVVRVRDQFALGDYNEAYHQLYIAFTPQGCYEPWRAMEGTVCNCVTCAGNKPSENETPAPSSNSKVYEDGELWSFIRRCMAQGKDIHLDHAERTYEEYSARLDVAALERLPELQDYIVRAVVAACGSNETLQPHQNLALARINHLARKGRFDEADAQLFRDAIVHRPGSVPHHHIWSVNGPPRDPDPEQVCDFGCGLKWKDRQEAEAHAQKANSCVCGEPNSPGTHRTDGPCLAPIGDHHP